MSYMATCKKHGPCGHVGHRDNPSCLKCIQENKQTSFKPGSTETVERAKKTIEEALALAGIIHSKATVGICGFEIKIYVYDEIMKGGEDREDKH